MRKATQAYADTAKQHFEEQKRDAKSAKLADLDKQNVDAGDAVGKAAEEYLAAKETKVNKMADAVFIVADIANEANTTRLNEKGYILSQDAKYWTGLNEHITKLSKLYEDLRKVSLTAEDQQRIERADKATQEYLVAAKSWVENDTKLDATILPEMKKGGETVLATAQAAENDAWKSSDDAGTTVLGVVGSSKTIIIITLIVGVIVALALGCYISRSISKVLGALIGEAKRLSKAAVEGQLQTRGNPELVTPEFRPIVEGVNTTLDAVIGPLNVAAEYVDRISKGDIPARITDTYNGDFNEIKNNLNQCINVMNGLLRETNALIQATQDGKLQTRGNAAAVCRRLGRIGGRREQAHRRLRGPHQRHRRVHRSDLQGRHPAEDYRHLQRRFQRNQAQPECLHRRHERVVAGNQCPDPGDPGRQAPDPRQRAAVYRRLERVGGRREQAHRRLRGPHQGDCANTSTGSPRVTCRRRSPTTTTVIST